MMITVNNNITKCIALNIINLTTTIHINTLCNMTIITDNNTQCLNLTIFNIMDKINQ